MDKMSFYSLLEAAKFVIRNRRVLSVCKSTNGADQESSAIPCYKGMKAAGVCNMCSTAQRGIFQACLVQRHFYAVMTGGR